MVVTYPISISSVCERDIDLLLLEEFLASPAFLQWFVGQVASAPIKVKELLDAQQSVKQSYGESDLEVLIQDTAGNTTYFLIENKIDAVFQPRQAERYQIRGRDYQLNENCTSFQTVLVAPKRYFASDTALKGFEARLTYEEISNWFKHQKQAGARQRYKVALLQAAINKGIDGYRPVKDDAVTDFWHQYWQLSQAHSPALNMKEPGIKPRGASSILFSPGSLPPTVTLVHKLSRGRVDLEFSGMGPQLNWLSQQFEGATDTDMRFERAGKSGCISLQVPSLSITQKLITQKAAALQGISAATRLLGCYESVNNIQYANA